MSRSEFRWNKKRKHYAYLFKDIGDLRLCLIFTTKPYRLVNGKYKENIKLFKHPNPNSSKCAYIIPFIYIDSYIVFFEKVYKWCFDGNDKRRIKRIKKTWKKKKSQR